MSQLCPTLHSDEPHIPTARTKFRVGQRVRMTTLAIEAGVSLVIRTGVVVGFSRNAAYVRVRVSGRKTPVLFHKKFWW